MRGTSFMTKNLMLLGAKPGGSTNYSSSNARNKVAETVHAKAIKEGSLNASNLGSCLLVLYVKSQDFDNARKLFDEIPDRDVRTWTILLSGFSRNGLSEAALELFKDMLMKGERPNQFALSSVLKSCSTLREIKLGKMIHAWVLRNGCDIDVALENSFLDLYVKCHAFDYVKRLFEKMENRDNVSWNKMLAGHLLIGEVDKSLELFKRSPFKDLVSWNTMIDGLVRIGYERNAIELLYQMVENGSMFNEITFSIALVLASSILDIEMGKQIHARILRLGVCVDAHLRNSLVNMYCKCGHVGKAWLILNKTQLNAFGAETSELAQTISWSSMVSGYVQNHDYVSAFKVFCYLVCEQRELNSYTLTSIISACAKTTTLEFGRQVHAYIHKSGHKVDAYLGSSLIEMYAKHGSLKDAILAFKQTKVTNVVLWTSIISCCALHGEGVEAIQLFEEMIETGITPTEVTFNAILTACSHGGLVEEGEKYFMLMREVYGIEPSIEHWTCMVDIYGRAGLLNEAKNFISKNSLSHINSVWRSLLSSCRLHKNIEIGKRASEQLLKLEPLGVNSYLLSSSISAIEHRWEEAAEVRGVMRERGMEKDPGKSWVQTKNVDLQYI